MLSSWCFLLLFLVRGTLLYSHTTPYQKMILHYHNCGSERHNITKCKESPTPRDTCLKTTEFIQCDVKEFCNTAACHSSPSGSAPSPAVAVAAGLQKDFFLDGLKNKKCTDPDQVFKNPDLGARHPNFWGHACPHHPAKLREMWYTGGHSVSLWAILLNLFFGFLCVAFLFYNVHKWLNLGSPLSTSVGQWANDRLTSASETVSSSRQAEETSMTPVQDSATGIFLAMTPQQHSMAASTSGSQASLQVGQETPMNEQPLAPSQMTSQETAQQVAQPPSVEQQTNVPNDITVGTEQPQVVQPQVQPQQQSQDQPQEQLQVQAQQQAQPQPMASNELPSDGSSPLAYQPTAQENSAVGQPDYFSPQQQLAYPPRGPPLPGYSGPGPSGFPPPSAGYPVPGPRGFPPRSAGFPPRPGGYNPGPRGFPPGPGGYPPRSTGYPVPGPRGFPPQSAGFSNGPRGYAPGPGGFPPRSAGYVAPGPRGFPPRSAGYPPPGPRGIPPGPAGLPPRSAGFDPRMARPGSASGGQWPRPG